MVNFGDIGRSLALAAAAATAIIANAPSVQAQGWDGCTKCQDWRNGKALLSLANTMKPVEGNSIVAGGSRNKIETGKMRVQVNRAGSMTLHDFDDSLVWNSNSKSPSEQANYAIMQPDGNLVVYTADGKSALWASGSSNKGTGPYCALLQQDRNFVLYDKSCKALWSTDTNIADRPADGKGNCRIYTVVQDDYCDLIAGKNGISTAQLQKYNPKMVCTAIQLGERLCVSLGTKLSRAPKPNGANCAPYTVKKDESCSKIAAAYDLTVQDLETFNKKTFHWIGCNNLQLGTNMCLSTGNPPKPPIIKGTSCGPQSVSGKDCPLKACCSAWGYCGTTEEFCKPTASGFPCISNCNMPTVPVTDGSAFQRKVGYYLSDAASRSCDTVSPEQLDLTGYTHVIFAFAVIRDGALTFSSTKDADLAKRLIDAASRYSGLKVLLGVGGWDFSESAATKHVFTDVISTAEKRNAFFASQKKLFSEYAFAGIDVDFDDVDNFGKFMAELRTNNQGGIVTAAIPASFWFLKGFDLEVIMKACDFVGVMTYDMNGPWNAGPAGKWDPSVYYKTAPHTGLKDVKDTTMLLVRAGVPLNKVNFGIAYYGRTYKLQNAACTAYGCPMTGGGSKGPCTQTSGFWSYAEIERVIATGRPPIIDMQTATAYLSVNDDFITFDNDNTISLKIQYAKVAGYGGSMAWAIDLLPANSQPIKVPGADPNADNEELDLTEDSVSAEERAQVYEESDPSQYYQASDQQSIGPLLANNHAELKKSFDADALVNDRTRWEDVEGDLPDGMDLLMKAASRAGDGKLWAHQQLQVTWIYIQDLWDALTRSWSEIGEKEAFESDVRKYLQDMKGPELTTWLRRDKGNQFFTCSFKKNGGDVSKIPDVNSDDCFKQAQWSKFSTGTPSEETWRLRSEKEEEFWNVLGDEMGLTKDMISFGTVRMGPEKKVTDNVNQVVLVNTVGFPLVNKKEYPFHYGPLIDDFLGEGKPDFTNAANEVSRVEKLDWKSLDVGKLADWTDSMLISVSSWFSVYQSWWNAKNLNSKISEELEKQRKAAMIDLILNIVFMFVGELIGPLLGLTARLASGASRGLKGIGGDLKTAQAIEAAGKGGIEAAKNLRNTAGWRNSKAVSALNKMKEFMKKGNLQNVCMFGEVAWEVGQNFLPAAALARRRSSEARAPALPSRAEYATFPDTPVAPFDPSDEVALPTEEDVLFMSEWSVANTTLLGIRSDYGFQLPTTYHFVNLESRAPRQDSILKLDVNGQKKNSLGAQFAKMANARGYNYKVIGSRKYQDDKLKPYVASSAGGTSRLPISHWDKMGMALDVEHIVEKGDIASRLLKPLILLHQNIKDPAVKTAFEIVMAADYNSPSGYNPNEKGTYSQMIADCIHGEDNVAMLDNLTNNLKKHIVKGTFDTTKPPSEAYANEPVSKTLSTYINDFSTTMETNAKRVTDLQTALLNKIKTIPGIDKEPAYTTGKDANGKVLFPDKDGNAMTFVTHHQSGVDFLTNMYNGKTGTLKLVSDAFGTKYANVRPAPATVKTLDNGVNGLKGPKKRPKKTLNCK
ncbi:hypothetical protein DFJ77DRAFT_521713 [Powellomyces hirtus]|nr:hypothetical protein DFJ77DRAFT_521713 [Powellomyces hirtus]